MYKLIIVEDEPLMSDFISKNIEYNDCNIELCGICFDGEQAEETILRINPDIVITDINMPGKNGLELISNLLNNSNTKDINFIVISGYSDFNLVKEAFKLGVKDYFTRYSS